MTRRMQTPAEKSIISCHLTSCQQDPLRVAVIVEDLRLPFDEGAKKTCFSLLCSFVKKGVRVSIFTWYRNPLLGSVFPLPHNKFLFGNSFARNLRAMTPDVILYMPASSGTVGALIRAVLIKRQASNIPIALLNLQYRKLPAFARYFGFHRYIDIVFAQSQNSRGIFHSFGFKTILLPGAVDHTIFRPASKEEKRRLRLRYGFQESDQIVLHTGHCNHGRNVTNLARLVDSGFRVILIASTSTTVDSDLLWGLRQSGVKVITDFIENIQHFYQLADCYLFPVFQATSAIDAPLSILEAMACNLPIVATPFGALPSMFEPGNGLYYCTTEGEMIEMTKKAVEEDDCKTFEKVSVYSWENLAMKMLETFEETIHL